MGSDTLTYDASISGWSIDNDSFPRLDSIRFDLRGKEITNTIVIEKTKYKKKHWNYGIVGGIGYGITNQKPDAFIGFGVMYNF